MEGRYMPYTEEKYKAMADMVKAPLPKLSRDLPVAYFHLFLQYV